MDDLYAGWDGQIVKALLEEFDHVTSREDMCVLLGDAVAAGRIEELDVIHYRCGSYLIDYILESALRPRAAMLEMLNEKKFSIFPQLVQAPTCSSFGLLVVKIPGMNGKDLIPFYKIRKEIPRPILESAYADVQRLCKANLYIPWKSRGDWGWRVAADSYQVVAPLWLNIVEDADKKEEILRIYHDYLLGDQYGVGFQWNPPVP